MEGRKNGNVILTETGTRFLDESFVFENLDKAAIWIIFDPKNWLLDEGFFWCRNFSLWQYQFAVQLRHNTTLALTVEYYIPVQEFC